LHIRPQKIARQLAFDSRRFRPQEKIRIRRNCIECGKPIEVIPAVARYGYGKYCSRNCFAKNYVIGGKGFRMGIKGGFRKDLGMYFRSSWEANWARYLNWRKERREIKGWSFESETFEFPVKKGSKFYTPDFKITALDGSIYFEEIKGWMDQKSRTKLKRMRIHYPEVKIEVIDFTIYRQAAKQLVGIIPNWEKKARSGW
jgi:hypothetical protein